MKRDEGVVFNNQDVIPNKEDFWLKAMTKVRYT